MASDNKRGRSGSEPIGIPDDKDVGQVQEQPPSKKRRTSQRDVKRAADGLDSGEVVDTAQSSPPRGHAGWNEGVKSAGLRLSFGSKISGPTEKKVTVPTSQEPETTADTMVVRVPAAETRAEATMVGRDEPVTAEPGLSKGAAKKRRRKEKKAAEEEQPASFKAAQPSVPEPKTRAQALKAAEAAAAAATPVNAPAAANEEAKKKEKSQCKRYKAHGQTWRLPPRPGPDWELDKSATRQFKFEHWAQDYVALNRGEKQTEMLRDPVRLCPILRDAYGRWQGKSRLKKRDITLLVEYEKQGRFALLLSTIMENLDRGKSMSPLPPLAEAGSGEEAEPSPKSDAPAVHPNSETVEEERAEQDTPASRSPGEISEDNEDLEGDAEMDDEEDEAYRQRYYPGNTKGQVFCTSCASFGHRTTSCPDAKCRFCDDSEHMAPGCPTRQRCAKCKQLGHATNACQEKLALAPGEGMECAFCASKDHTESDCTEFFRTFRPSAKTIRTVKHIPIFCYCCGNEGHYGTQCGLNAAPTKTARVDIWSKENWQQFVDPNSSEEAIAWDSAAGGNGYAHDANGRPDFGKSIVPRTHIVFEDEDDEEEEEGGGFLRPPVQRQRQQQQQQQRQQFNPQINVSRPGRGGFSSLAQQSYNQKPPLPPGPPPGLPARPPLSNDAGNPRPKRPRKQGGQPNGRGGATGGGGFHIRGGANRGRGRGGGGGNRGGRR